MQERRLAAVWFGGGNNQHVRGELVSVRPTPTKGHSGRDMAILRFYAAGRYIA